MKPRVPFPWALFRFWFLRLLPLWGFAALMIFLTQIAVCAIVHDNQNVQAMLKFLEVLPSFVKSALGGDILQAGNVPALIAIGYQHPFVLFLFLLFAVGAPTLLLTGEVQRGMMELILSRPITKTQVYVCASALTLTGMFALVQTMFLGTAVATRIYDFGQPIALDLFFRIAINGGLMATAAGAIALLVAGVMGGRRAAVGITVALLVINYGMWAVSMWWPKAGFLCPATLFYYTDGLRLLRGWPLDDMAVLGGVTLVCTVVGGVVWRRRDLPL